MPELRFAHRGGGGGGGGGGRNSVCSSRPSRRRLDDQRAEHRDPLQLHPTHSSGRPSKGQEARDVGGVSFLAAFVEKPLGHGADSALAGKAIRMNK